MLSELKKNVEQKFADFRLERNDDKELDKLDYEENDTNKGETNANSLYSLENSESSKTSKTNKVEVVFNSETTKKCLNNDIYSI